MTSTPSQPRRGPLIHRVAGLAMVLLAIGLTVVGNILAFEQVRSVTTRLMAEATARAGQVAAQANERFPQRLASALRILADHLRRQTISPGRMPERVPEWVGRIYVWDGIALQRPWSDGLDDPAVTAAVESVVTAGPLGVSALAFVPSPQIDFARIGTREAAIAQLAATDADLRPVVIAAVLDQALIASEFLASLVASDEALEVAYAGNEPVAGAQKLSGALRPWAIRPARRFVDDQRRTVLAQTLVYVGLTTVALATLLLAMWSLTRVVRREVGLAELKASFVADVSHELKTPLALIRMFAETLREGRVVSKQKQQEYYEVILRESARLTDLINNILDFSRIDAGRKEYRFEPTDVAEVVRQVYASYRPQLEHAGFEHDLRMEEGLPPVDADRGAIAQILVNLIANAVKYSENEKHLRLELTSDTRRNRRGVLMSVHDRGIGIAPQDRAMLTEGFYRASDARVRARTGAGLGLAVVRHIVDAHGGTLDVESRLVKGSTFRVFLPAAPEPLEPEEK